MANVAKPHKVTNGAKAINYVLGRKDQGGHNGADKRNELVFTRYMHGGESYISQMQRYWDMAAERHTTQCVSCVFGFSKNELNPDDPDAAYLAEYAVSSFYDKLEEQDILPKGHQVLFAVQKDGKNGNIHVHSVMCDVNMVDHKGLPQEMRWGPLLTSEFQKHCEELNLFEVDYGKDKNSKDVSYSRGERILREQGKPVFKDIVRERIDESLANAKDVDDFKVELKNRGITISEQKDRKGNLRYKYNVDPSTLNGLKNKTNNYSLRSTSLGESYSPESIESYFAQSVSDKQTILSRNEFLEKNYDFIYGKGLSIIEATKLAEDAYEEYKRTGKMPSDEEENDTNTPEATTSPVQDEQVITPVISSDEEESQKKKGRRATRSHVTVESIEAAEKQNMSEPTKARYARINSMDSDVLSEQDNLMIEAVMRKAVNIPDAEHDKDRYYGE